ncbi:proteophosphoglycan ppg4, partial [Moniliophthora roreri]
MGTFLNDGGVGEEEQLLMTSSFHPSSTTLRSLAPSPQNSSFSTLPVFGSSGVTFERLRGAFVVLSIHYGKCRQQAHWKSIHSALYMAAPCEPSAFSAVGLLPSASLSCQ